MIKRRKRLTEPETRFFMKQLLEAVEYLHEQLVIHRDLKLGNLFLDKNLNIKVGDLGLATKLESADEKRKTICGTTNYIAPEVIQGDRASRGHSFEVDVWSMGVIMFTCLVGKPPYEAKDVKATYQRILANEYAFPTDIAISNDAKDLIYCMLQSKPQDRPTLKDIGFHPFLTANAIPKSLPSNATHVAPQFDKMDSASSHGSTNSQTKCAERPALPKSGSQRRPFGARDVNVDAHPPTDRIEKKSAPVVPAAPKPREKEMTPASIMDVQGVVKHAWSAVVNAATATTTSASTPQSAARGFQVFDETGSYNSKQQNDLIARTSKMGIQSFDPSRCTGAFNCSSPPEDHHTTPSAGSATSQTNAIENDVFTLHKMVDRISIVLDVVSQRSYSKVCPDSPSLTAFSRGGPTKWVARYVDYTSKYGLGYLLNDGRYARFRISFFTSLFLR